MDASHFERWKGRDSNPRPRHYEIKAQPESRVRTIAYATRNPSQGRFRPFESVQIRMKLYTNCHTPYWRWETHRNCPTAVASSVCRR
jgi:hypothetical protein